MDISRTRPPDPFDSMPPRPSFTLISDDVTDGQELSSDQAWNSGGVGGANISPHLAWSGFPAETKGFAVTVFDPDAPTACGWWHWIVVGLDAETTELPSGAGDAAGSGLPAGAYQLRNDYGTVDFGGAGPPPGDHAHRYIFTVYALDTDDLGIDPEASGAVASATIAFHTLARAHIVGTYQL